MRLTSMLLGATLLALVPACGVAPQPASGDSVTVGEESVTNGHLWILNRTGNPSLSDFYDCLLNHTNWNQLAAAYKNPLLVTLGKEVFVSGATCNPGGPDDQAAFQCAVNVGRFDVKPYDLVLIIRDDNNAGGQNDSGGGTSVRNPITGATVPIDTSEVGSGSRFGTWDYLYVYSSHEVFEAQTDGVSADCCDGETAYGGSFPWCSACGGPTGSCGKHQGDLGIGHLTCPSGKSYPYQTVSPPGGYYYGSPEFNGTCQTVHVTSTGGGGWSCGSSQYNGQQYWTCSNGTINKCDSAGHVESVACGAAGCKSNPSGTDDTCNWSCASSANNGAQYWTCTGGNLFECDGAGHPRMTFCNGLGCKMNASGVNDQCYEASPGWGCGSSQGSDGKQYWTCGGDGNIHQCSGGTPVELKCGSGCNVNPPNSNDTCK